VGHEKPGVVAVAPVVDVVVVDVVVVTVAGAEVEVDVEVEVLELVLPEGPPGCLSGLRRFRDEHVKPNWR
jgi:hypothetical protein